MTGMPPALSTGMSQRAQPGNATPLARLALLAAVGAAALAVLLTLIRPWYTSWGATATERAARLPGDDIAPGTARATRAVSVAAPAEQVFPWLAQLGQDRGGFYSYDVLENLVGCEMPRIERLDPALQHWSVGQKLWMYPEHKLDGEGYARLLELLPGRALAFGTHQPGRAAQAPAGSWSLVVEPAPGGARLLARHAGGSASSLLGAAFHHTVFEPLHFAMERRMLEGIRGLAEGQPLSQARDVSLLSLWLLCAAALLASAVLVVLGRHWRRRLATFAAAAVVFQVLTLVQPEPMLGALLVLPVLGLGWWPLTRGRASAGAASAASSGADCP
jgi:hypothetical protein